MIEIKLTETDKELIGIRALQESNLHRNLSIEEASEEGFVTASYTLEFLKYMHEAHPSVIAKDGDEVVGYALVATHAVSHQHDLLKGLFSEIDALEYKGLIMKGRRYVVVGQLCVGKGYRGKGLAKRMYDFFRDALREKYDFALTDVVSSNLRSLRAHEKTGFIVAGTLQYGGVDWDLVLWDWTR